MDADQVAPMDSGSEPIISDLIDITIKTIDSKNFQFQVENDVSFCNDSFWEYVTLTYFFIDSNQSF